MKKKLEIISFILSVIIIGVLIVFYVIDVTDPNKNENEISDRDMLEMMSHGHTH